MRDQGGLIVVETLKDACLNGPTTVFDMAVFTQASAGIPAAGPVTVTVCTLPLDPKTIVAREGASWPTRH